MPNASKTFNSRFFVFWHLTGGFDLGFERAGIKTVWQVENNEFCRRILERHWPNVERFTDVRECGALPAVDVITGGFPCKQTSTISAVHKCRHGLSGKDSGLWWDYLRIVRAARPVWVVVENVAGVRQWADQITDSLEGLGYTVSKSEHQASDVGAPHSRLRVLFVANLNGQRLQTSGEGISSPAIEKNWPAPPDNLWREHQPGVWRMDNGLPRRVDRIKSLGNAIVPQIAEWIGKRIMACASPDDRKGL